MSPMVMENWIVELEKWTTSPYPKETSTILASTTCKYLGQSIQISFISVFRFYPTIFST